MPRAPLCPYCEKEVSLAQPFKEFNKRKYHLPCYRKMQQERFDKEYEREVVKKDIKEELFSYIKNIFNTQEVDTLILKQIENYCIEYGLDYQQIYDTLYYFFTIMGNTTKGIKGIGIVPYVLAEAKDFYSRKNEAHELLKNKEIKIETTTINVVPKKAPKKDLIDINNL